MPHLRLVAVSNIQSGTERINEVEVALLAGPDHLSEFFCFWGGIRFAPNGAMLQVVFGRIKIRVQSPTGHPIEQLKAFRLRPRLSIEAFDHPSPAFCPFAICRMLVRFDSGRLSGQPVFWQDPPLWA